MPKYSPWTWSPAHGKHYSYLLSDTDQILDTFWSGPTGTPHSGLQRQASNLPPPGRERRKSRTGTDRSAPGQNLTAQPTSGPSTRNQALVTPTEGDAEGGGREGNEGEAGEQENDEDDAGQAEALTEDMDREKTNERNESYEGLGKGKRIDSGVDPTVVAASQLMHSLHLGSSPPSNVFNRSLPNQSLNPPHYTQNPAHTYASSSGAQLSKSPAVNAHQGHPSTPSAAPNAPKSFQTLIAAQNYTYSYFPGPQTNRSAVATLPSEVQATIGYKDRRYIQTGTDPNIAETLDNRFRRVVKHHHAAFFVLGRVFKMLWTEPAGQTNPGRTRNSTHFSTVWLNEQAFSEIRYFVVVRNKGTFSQCIPVQTYGKKGATKPGLVMHDHGIIHTTPEAPRPLPGEHLTKYSIRVEPNENETLDPLSRVNYGKAYAVEHNVKVLDIGMVTKNHQYMIEQFFDAAMRGQ